MYPLLPSCVAHQRSGTLARAEVPGGPVVAFLIKDVAPVHPLLPFSCGASTERDVSQSTDAIGILDSLLFAIIFAFTFIVMAEVYILREMCLRCLALARVIKHFLACCDINDLLVLAHCAIVIVALAIITAAPSYLSGGALFPV